MKPSFFSGSPNAASLQRSSTFGGNATSRTNSISKSDNYYFISTPERRYFELWSKRLPKTTKFLMQPEAVMILTSSSFWNNFKAKLGNKMVFQLSFYQPIQFNCQENIFAIELFENFVEQLQDPSFGYEIINPTNLHVEPAQYSLWIYDQKRYEEQIAFFLNKLHGYVNSQKVIMMPKKNRINNKACVEEILNERGFSYTWDDDVGAGSSKNPFFLQNS